MEQLYSSIGSLARQMLGNFTRRTRRDGTPYWDLREDVDWQHQVVMEAWGNRMLCAEAYNTAFKLLLEIYIASNEEEAEEFLYEIEPYSEVRDLTGWLNSAPEHVEYLTEVLQADPPRDGREALARAHWLFLQDAGERLLKAIKHCMEREEALQEVEVQEAV